MAITIFFVAVVLLSQMNAVDVSEDCATSLHQVKWPPDRRHTAFRTVQYDVTHDDPDYLSRGKGFHVNTHNFQTIVLRGAYNSDEGRLHNLPKRRLQFLSAQSVEHPFVTVPYEIPNINNATIKKYTTDIQLQVELNDTFNDSVFTNAVANYYGQLGGYLNVSIVHEVNQTNNASANYTVKQIRYDVMYHYVTLNESVQGSDVAIQSMIGNITALQIGLVFNYTVLNDSFVFRGNEICSLCSGCCEVNMECTETTEGINVSCVSTCYVNNICHNGGYCIHEISSLAPTCNCHTSQNDWYVGNRCESHLNIWMPIVFFVVAFLLFVLVFVLTLYCIKTIDKRLEKERHKAAKKALKKHNDDVPKPKSKNKKVFASLSSALGFKGQPRQESVKTEAATTIPPISQKPLPVAETKPEDPQPAVLSRSSVATSAESTHEPNSFSSDSEVVRDEPLGGFSYEVPESLADDAASKTTSSYSSSEDVEDERYIVRFPNTEDTETAASEHAYATVHKKPIHAQETTV